MEPLTPPGGTPRFPDPDPAADPTGGGTGGGTGDATTGAGAAAPRRGRRVATVLLVVLLTGAALAGGGVAWQQREVAAGWQERATGLEEQRDEAVGRAEALSGQLQELANLVELAGEDLATIEERLAELAGEKAQAEDRAALTRDELRLLADRVATAVDGLEACVVDLLELQRDTVTAFNSATAGSPVDVAPLNERLRAIDERCREARTAGRAAAALAARLR